MKNNGARESSGFVSRPWRGEIILLLLVLALTSLIYHPRPGMFFTQDTFIGLVKGMYEPIRDAFVYRGLWYRPLTSDFGQYYVEYRIFGLNPWGYFVVNTTLHLINTLLVIWLISALSRSVRLGLVGGFFYGPHTAHMMAVYFIDAFHDLLVAFFYLLSVLSLTLIFRNERRLIVRWSLWLISIFAAAGALMSKEISVMLPGALLITLAFLVASRPADFRLRSVLVQLAWITPHILLLFSYLLYRFVVGRGSLGGLPTYSLDPHPRIVLGNLFQYVIWSLNVSREGLIGGLLSTGLSKSQLRDWLSFFPLWIPLLIIGVSGILLLIALKRLGILCHRRLQEVFVLEDIWLLGFGLCWWFITVIPILLIPHNNQPRYLTIPLMGAAIVFAVCIRWLYARRRWVSVLICCSFLVMSIVGASIALRTYPSFIGGPLARTLLTDVQAVYPELSPGAVLYIEALPFEAHWAIGGGAMYQVFYGRKDLVFAAELTGLENVADYVRSSMESSSVPPDEVRTKWPGREVYWFRFSDGRLIPVSR